MPIFIDEKLVIDCGRGPDACCPVVSGRIRSYSGGSPMKEHFPPVMRGLLRVIPIAQAQEHGDILVTLIALETYPDGCILSLMFGAVPGAPRADERFGRAPMALTMRDDTGRAYDGGRRMIGMGGHDYSGRALVPFYTQPLAPGVRALYIEIPELRWEHSEPREDGGWRAVPGETTNGPWRFTVAVAADDGRGQDAP